MVNSRTPSPVTASPSGRSSIRTAVTQTPAQAAAAAQLAAAQQAMAAASQPQPPQQPSPADLAATAESNGVSTGTANSLRALPAIRQLNLRWQPPRGTAAGSYRALNLNTRAPNAEAALAQMRGTVPAAACGSCAREGGPFTECVVVAGQMKGSCANCHYGSEGARCSFRKTAPATAAAGSGAAETPARMGRGSGATAAVAAAAAPAESRMKQSTARKMSRAERLRAISRSHRDLAVLYAAQADSASDDEEDEDEEEE